MDATQTTMQRGYPLGALFLLMAAIATIAAMLSPLVTALAKEQVEVPIIMAVAGGAGLFSVIIGAIVGLLHFRQPQGVLTGAMTGALIGPLFGPIMLVPVHEITSLCSVTIGGSILIVIVAAIVRLSGRTPVPVRDEDRIGFNEDDVITAEIADSEGRK